MAVFSPASAGKRRRRRAAPYVVAVLALAMLAAVSIAIVLISARGGLAPDAYGLARVKLPLGGGRVENISVVTGPHSQPLPVSLAGGRLAPDGPIPAGADVSIQVTIRRPGWLAWLTGARERLALSVRTPSAIPGPQYVTLNRGAALTVRFSSPVSVVWYGAARNRMRRQALPSPQTQVTIPHRAGAGAVWVAGAPRTWESAQPLQISWFPAGARAGAVASPAPGGWISPGTPIAVTFSKPVARALGSALPVISPATPGTWRQTADHTLVFMPQGAGYGLGTHVTVALPAGVNLAGGANSRAGTTATWRVPAGSTLRLQQLLAQQGYLPLRFHPGSSGPARTLAAQEAAAIRPPAGTFNWRYANIPTALRSMWEPGASGEMTRGAVMAFEDAHGLATDGVAGPLVWKALISAAVAGQRSSFGYSFATVSVSAQRLALWHDGRTLVSTAVNTGAAGTPTQPGTFAVYEHLRVTTMSGTNPDGTHYHDPGIQFVSYFNGGDALHAFTRAQYGFPQSLGCVEMPLGPAGRLWPYTPIGTLVHVN